ncbi:MAG: hypothetical protein ABI776_16870 [Nocardioidaceae bacterium]
MSVHLGDHAGTKNRTTRFVQRGCLGVALAAAVVGLSTAPASAAPDGTTTANAVVTSGITLTALTPSFTLTGTPGATVQSGAVTYNVETNNFAGYSVTVSTLAATMLPGNTTTNTDTIPIGDLTVRETGTTPYTGISNVTPVTVHSQPGRSVNTGDPLSTEYQMRIPTVNVDTYSATLTYLAATL